VSKKKTKADNSQKYLFDDELKKLFNVIDNIEDRAVIEFGLETGLRASDITGILTSNIDFEHQYIKVWDEKKDTWRTVVFPKTTGNILKMYLNARKKNGQKLFPYSEKTLQRKLQEYCRQAKIRVLKKRKTGTSVGWHWLRHTFIRRSQMFGRDIKLVQQNTGDTIETILKYYRDLSIEDRIKEMESKPIYIMGDK
jgi:integrase